MDSKLALDAVNDELLSLYQNRMDDSKPMMLNSGSATSPNTNSAMSIELCLVCSDRASGRHYGAISCEGCKGFFKRSIRKQLAYQCRGSMNCEITKHHRNRCQFCRLQKCLACGMNSQSVQHERKPLLDKKEAAAAAAALMTNNSATASELSGLATFGSQGRVSTAANAKQNSRNDFLSSPTSANIGGLNNLFPVGMSFAEITSTLAQRAMLPNTYQDRFSLPFANLGSNNNNNNNTNSNVSDIDETSMDNSSTTANHTLGNLLPSDTIQSSIDKNVLAEAQDIIASLQYDVQNNNELINNNIKAMKQDQDDDAMGDEYDDFGDELAALIDGPFLTEQEIAFNLQPPNIVPHFLNFHYICESGSRILFLSIFWIKKFRCFRLLSNDAQVVLLRNCWVELFALGLAQSSHLISLSTIMSSLTNFMTNAIAQEKVPANKLKRLSEHIWKVNEFIQEMNRLQVDDYEYAFLRFITIFNADNIGIDAQQKSRIERLQDFALNYIGTYVKQKKQQQHDDDDGAPIGFNRILRLSTKLNILRALEPDLIEDLFFTNLIGPVQIISVIPHILNLGNFNA